MTKQELKKLNYRIKQLKQWIKDCENFQNNRTLYYTMVRLEELESFKRHVIGKK